MLQRFCENQELEENPGVFWDPPVSWAELLYENHSRLSKILWPWGNPLEARREVGLPLDRPIVFSGHQPVFFHPGLLFKFWTALALAKETQAYHVHKITDTDVPTAPGWRVPERFQGKAVFHFFENFSEETPELWRSSPSKKDLDETFRLLKESSFKAPRRGAEAFQARLQEAREEDTRTAFHREVLRLFDETGETVFLEGSGIWKTRSFLKFVDYVLKNADAFLDRLEKERETAWAPFGDAGIAPLEREGDWRETPFWVACEKEKKRWTLWKLSEKGKVFFRRESRNEKIPWDLERIREEKFRIWPKAVLQTFFCRTMLCDFFVHGTGGARYEKINQGLWCFFQQEPPPAFGTASATLWFEEKEALRLQERLAQAKKQESLFKELARKPENFWAEDFPLRPIFSDVFFPAEEGKKTALEIRSDQLHLQQEDFSGSDEKKKIAERLRRNRKRLLEILEPVFRRNDALVQEIEYLEKEKEVLTYREYPFFCYDPRQLEKLRESAAGVLNPAPMEE